MNQFFASLLMFLLLPTLAMAQAVPAQPVAVVNDSPRGKVGDLIPLTAKAEGNVKWVSLNPGLSFVPEAALKDSKVTFVTAAQAGEYRVLVYAAKADVPSDPVFVTVTVEPGPTPPPGPGPGPGPGPLPPPGPVVAQRLFLVIVEETADAVAGRGKMLSDQALAARIKEKGHRWRVVDKDVVGVDGQPPADVKRFLDAAKGKTLPQVFLVTEKGATLIQANLPATPAELVALLTKWGG